MRWTSDTMHVSYHQYYLCGADYDYEDLDEVQRLSSGNTLAVGSPERLTALSGTHSGVIRLTVEGLEGAPPAPGPEWESAVEVSLYSSSGELWLEPWGGRAVREAGNLAHAGPGWYRVRVQSIGRDRGHAEDTVFTWVEEHYLAIWPAPPEPDLVHRVTDEYGLLYYDPQRPPAQPLYPTAGPPTRTSTGG
ncbi:hypothetical protein [Streptacidiphilus fuscans]|uniref:Uncharacterized protein n=1 Tax=Streptacidiphilus fuscans TaxID=2789292 RepID=A0A931B1H7_9ACTN|nr:hypothetical protein [Streptacidiphilus fuscans]MBF9069374.1 hypothetical protein [Streptacidiphilus fuscans]